jgi:hypothetical protein
VELSSKLRFFYKEDNYKTIPSGFLTCIRLNPDLDISVNYVAAYLRYKENSIIINDKKPKKTGDKKPKNSTDSVRYL